MIKRILKEWVIPPRFLRMLQRARVGRKYGRLTAEEVDLLSQNATFKDRYAGRRCFVIGNGPSLNKQDLIPLRSEITIVTNHFYRHPILRVWQPTFYCAADEAELYTPQEIQRIRQGVSQISPEAFFVPLSVKTLIEQYGLFPQDKTYFLFLDMKGVLIDNWVADRRVFDLTSILPHITTTAHMALMSALYLGCSPIYLIGLDHDWLAHPSVTMHFYDASNEDVGGEWDHSSFDYKSLAEFIRRTWQTYEVLRDVATRQGVAIYNATAGGFLDVFPRVEFEKLFTGLSGMVE
jgi:hypothetical protein